MRHLRVPAILGLWALVGACGKEPQGPESLEPGDTAQTRGTLLTSGESVLPRSKLVWVPGMELVAFTSWTPTGEYAIKTVDARRGSTGLVDGDCASWTGLYETFEPSFRRLVAAPDGSALYYTVGIGDDESREWVLRVADPLGVSTSTLGTGVGGPLAVSPDGRQLAYDAVIVRDLLSGADRHYQETGGPIAFSPDGTELLYGVLELVTLSQVHRLSLDDGTHELVALPDGVLRTQLFHWGASGIEVLAEVFQQYPSEYYVLNLTTGGSVKVGSIRPGERERWLGEGAAWSMDGTRVAYWTWRCLEWGAKTSRAVWRVSRCS